MAACLESLGMQPVVVMVKAGKGWQRAFLGCWSRIEDRFEPILSDFERVSRAVEAGKLLLVECTGFSLREDREPKKFSYAEARHEARKQMDQEKFLYILDVSSLRIVPEKDRVTPLEFLYSPEVLRIIQEAHSIAWKKRSREIGRPHLLYGFLASGASMARKVFAGAGVDDMDRARDRVASGVSHSSPADPKYTKNYSLILGGACGLADRSNYRIVEEHHLLDAFLKSGGGEALTAIGRALKMF